MLALSLLALAVTAPAVGAAANATVMITHYSDAQCPCSARVPQDMKQFFLDNPDFEGLVDFDQYFVGDLKKDVHHCIHGDGECVAQRHFACAQNFSTVSALSYRDANGTWLDFEACSYGKCDDKAAILGKHHPCYNYSDFNDYQHNDDMKYCASRVGLDWERLNACGTGPQGDALMAASATRANNDGITYGADGLAPIFVDGVKVKTKKLIPLVCGPVPDEVKKAVCAALKAKGASPAACS